MRREACGNVFDNNVAVEKTLTDFVAKIFFCDECLKELHSDSRVAGSIPVVSRT